MSISLEIRCKQYFPGVLTWTRYAACRGRSELFFPPFREQPGERLRREALARSLCSSCPAQEACRDWARENREYGFWGGESEEERAAAGFRAAISGSGLTGLEREAV